MIFNVEINLFQLFQEGENYFKVGFAMYSYLRNKNCTRNALASSYFFQLLCNWDCTTSCASCLWLLFTLFRQVKWKMSIFSCCNLKILSVEIMIGIGLRHVTVAHIMTNEWMLMSRVLYLVEFWHVLSSEKNIFMEQINHCFAFLASSKSTESAENKTNDLHTSF